MTTIIYYDDQGNITQWMKYEKKLDQFLDPRPHLMLDYWPDIENSRVDLETLAVVPK